MEDFELELARMANKRVRGRYDFYESNKGKLFMELVDFKCWCFARGKFHNINENDYRQYKKDQNKKYNFNFEMDIFTNWFGYEFEYDNMKMRWKTVKNKHWVLNRKGEKNYV